MIRVLFISSGNRYDQINPIIAAQARSLENSGCRVNHFIINGRGITGYLKNLFRLVKQIKTSKYDIYHAHYSLSGILAGMAGVRPLVVSLMGSDLYSGRLGLLITRIFKNRIWDQTLVKSEKMKSLLGDPGIPVIPNGVDTTLFRPINREECMVRYNFNPERKHILFFGDARRSEKNISLAYESIEKLGRQDVDFHVIKGWSHENIPGIMSAADLLLVTSSWEGSPNVIKEAMACNLPVISTDVGDAADLLAGCLECFVCSFDKSEISDSIGAVLAGGKRSNGRSMIMNLDSVKVAGELVSLYDGILKKVGG